MRHHAITELAESNASEQTILSIAGHVSRRMLEHYSHVRIEAKRSALDGLASTPKSAPDRANEPEKDHTRPSSSVSGRAYPDQYPADEPG